MGRNAWLWRLAERCRPLLDVVGRMRWKGSARYWDARYARGGDSGSGSAGRIGEYKAQYLNDLVRRNHIESVLEFGCGDGRQLTLARYPRYVGLDVSAHAVERCRARFAGDPARSFHLYDPRQFDPAAAHARAELTLSLDVIYHLVEDEIFELHLAHLFGAAQRFVAVYSSNFDRVIAAHVRHRAFVPEVERRFPQFALVDRPPNPFPLERYGGEGSHASFFVFEKR